MTKRKMKTDFLTLDDFEDTDLENMGQAFQIVLIYQIMFMN